MQSRPPELQAFLDKIFALHLAGHGTPEITRSIRRIVSASEEIAPVTHTPGGRLPVCSHLPHALETASIEPRLAAVARALHEIDPLLNWRQRPSNPSASVNFQHGHANAMILGPGGLEDRGDVWVGVSLMAPHVRYPDHQHAPEEVYLVMSRGEFRQGDDPWFEPGIGGAFYNPPNILHAMRSGSTPLLAIWCLWAGQPSRD